ncbi:MAG: penicillin-binding protein 2, partial [Actinomycetota bacterium]|nr:penicillin-binding protein 2 [Actinomycetota bacterium]
MNDDSSRLRLAVLGIVTLSLFTALFARLWYLQVMSAPDLQVQAETNRFRRVHFEGERGKIVDREGRVLADNRESIVVTIDREEFRTLDDTDDLLVRLANRLNQSGELVKVSDIEARLGDARYDPFKPVPIAEDVSEELEVYLLERASEFPSVDVERMYVRTYPYGATAAHVLGYTGAINADELATVENAEKPYEGGDEIGKTGVEAFFESDLRGVPGERVIEIDRRNRDVGTVQEVEPQPGSDLQLTIDIELQEATERALADGLALARLQEKDEPEDPDFVAPAGAALVLDVDTGEILSMASNPTYDPAEFVGGISRARFGELNDAASHHPLTNRAIQSGYAPGSTFKTITAYAALTNGVISADEVIDDRGFHRLENCDGDTCEFQNAGRAVLGEVDMREAMTKSSDVYFYRLGETFWVYSDQYGGRTAIQDAARSFGFGSRTGVQLPSESSGTVGDPDLKASRHEQNPEAFPYGRWSTGDNVNLSIGQGDLLVTPLQLANAYATFANGGTVHATSIARSVLDPEDGTAVRSYGERELATVDLPPGIRDPIMDGLVGAIADEDGTAYDVFTSFPLDEFGLAGKTGTAQVNDKADTSVFVAFGPTWDPRYVVVAILEESGFAADAAAPVVRTIIEALPEVSDLDFDAGQLYEDLADEQGDDEDDDGEDSDDSLTVVTEAPTTTAPPATTTTTAPPATTT